MADQIYNVNCGFFDAVNSDRTYSADDMNKPYKRVVADGVFASPAGTPSTDFLVEPNNGMSIKVNAGDAIIGTKWFQSGSIIAITVPSNTGLTTRKDSVILQVDNRLTGRVGNVVYRTGTTDVPALDSTMVEYRLANVSVSAGATSITGANIEDLRGSAACPWVSALIIQPDTSTMWQNFYAAYAASLADFEQQQNAYMAEAQQAWDDFFNTLTETLSVTMNLATLKNTYTAAGVVTSIPIGIAGYDASTDVLLVFINGLLASPSMYTVSGSNVVLTNSIAAGNKVDFLVLKSVVAGDMASTISLIQQLSNALTLFMADSEWQDITLQSGTSYDSSNKPQYRTIGGKAYLRGAVKGISVGTIAELADAPDADVSFLASATNGSSITGFCQFVITTAGLLQLVATSGTIGSSDCIRIDAHYLPADVATAIVTDIPNGDEVNY